jgi:hypothetical protein
MTIIYTWPYGMKGIRRIGSSAFHNVLSAHLAGAERDIEIVGM